MSHPDVVFRGKDYVVTRLTDEEDMALMSSDQVLFRELESWPFLLKMYLFNGQNPLRDADEARRQSDLYGV